MRNDNKSKLSEIVATTLTSTGNTGPVGVAAVICKVTRVCDRYSFPGLLIEQVPLVLVA